MAMKFRAQVQAMSGGWVDGGLFAKRANAEQDAERLGALYERPSRVIEVEA